MSPEKQSEAAIVLDGAIDSMDCLRGLIAILAEAADDSGPITAALRGVHEYTSVIVERLDVLSRPDLIGHPIRA
jgi:hypothetical protein